MIAAFRVRFTPTPASSVWSDALFANWLNAGIQFSLAHYWAKTSFGQADLRHEIFPPIVIDDPRAGMKPEERAISGKDREYLVNGVTAKATDEFNPDWGAFDAILIWFAQPTDMFGGGGYPVPLGYIAGGGGLLDFLFGEPEPEKKYLPVAVCDVASPFDGVCQELGHAFGFDHSYDRTGTVYGDPYDVMSAQIYGGKNSAFVRATFPALPIGTFVNGVEQNSVVGPLVSAAQLYNSPLAGELKKGGLFVDVPARSKGGTTSFTLYALDEAADLWPSPPGPVLGVVPPASPLSDTYFLELRRSAGYDRGFLGPGVTDATRPPIGVVIHYFDQNQKRVVYVDTVPLINNNGDTDYNVGGAGFTIRVTSVGANFRSVGLTVGGGDFWRNFGVDLTEVRDEVISTTRTRWQRMEVSPCFMFPVGVYQHRYRLVKHQFTLIASSFGYEKPGYTWTLNGTALNPALNTVSLPVNVELPQPAGGTQFDTRNLSFQYTAAGNTLVLTCEPLMVMTLSGNFNIAVELKVAEHSPGVLKNIYEDRTLVTSLRFNTVAIEWDQNYQQKLAKCKAAIVAVNKKRIPVAVDPRPKPEPDPFVILPELEQVIRGLIETNPAAANAVIDQVSRMTNLRKVDILRRL